MGIVKLYSLDAIIHSVLTSEYPTTKCCRHSRN